LVFGDARDGGGRVIKMFWKKTKRAAREWKQKAKRLRAARARRGGRWTWTTTTAKGPGRTGAGPPRPILSPVVGWR
jgi:hypothetical protein